MLSSRVSRLRTCLSPNLRLRRSRKQNQPLKRLNSLLNLRLRQPSLRSSIESRVRTKAPKKSKEMTQDRQKKMMAQKQTKKEETSK